MRDFDDAVARTIRRGLRELPSHVEVIRVEIIRRHAAVGQGRAMVPRWFKGVSFLPFGDDFLIVIFCLLKKDLGGSNSGTRRLCRDPSRSFVQ